MQKQIKKLCGAGVVLLLSMRAHADRYGIDESLGESDASVSDMFWGALIVGIVYLIWKKFRG